MSKKEEEESIVRMEMGESLRTYAQDLSCEEEGERPKRQHEEALQ